ncbi:hypothetical protein O9929_20890 [Vibrio lentus]|nr:hypothetical protein [Vibrio lentus]
MKNTIRTTRSNRFSETITTFIVVPLLPSALLMALSFGISSRVKENSFVKLNHVILVSQQRDFTVRADDSGTDEIADITKAF